MRAQTNDGGRDERTRHPGVYLRHSRDCGRVQGGSKCSCKPSYRAVVYDKRSKKMIRKTFRVLAEAKLWRADAVVAVERGTLKPPTATTVGEALSAYVAGMVDGTILDRSGRQYKPATCRSYRRSVEKRLQPELRHFKLGGLRRRDVQDMIDRLRASGISASTIRNTLDPLRAVYRRAVRRDEVTIDPTHGLELPAIRGRRDRTASPSEAEALIEALPVPQQALWAMAIYVGPRRGELQELRWSDLDLKQNVGRIERAWDDEGRCVVDVKTAAGERWFPIVEPVKRRLIAHKLATGRDGDDLVFGETADRRFVPSTVRRRARKAWEAAKLQPITLHEGRHSAATAGSAAGLDDLALAHIMGHSSVVITRDRYGHVRPDRVAEVAKLLDAYYAEAKAASGKR